MRNAARGGIFDIERASLDSSPMAQNDRKCGNENKLKCGQTLFKHANLT